MNTPDEDPSCSAVRLGGGVILTVSVSVSMQERIAATVGFGIGFRLRLLVDLILFSETNGVSRIVVVAVVRRRKLTRFRNDGLFRMREELKARQG